MFKRTPDCIRWVSGNLLLTGSPPAASCIKLTSVAVCSTLKSQHLVDVCSALPASLGIFVCHPSVLLLVQGPSGSTCSTCGVGSSLLSSCPGSTPRIGLYWSSTVHYYLQLCVYFYDVTLLFVNQILADDTLPQHSEEG